MTDWNPFAPKEIVVEDMAATLRTVTSYDLVGALYRLECDLIKGRVYIRDKRYELRYVCPEIHEIWAELGSRQQVDLKPINTRQLLDWLKQSRQYSGWWHPGGQHNDLPVSAAAIKAELATRPHIPNKKEARANRQKAAKNARAGKQRYSHK